MTRVAAQSCILLTCSEIKSRNRGLLIAYLSHQGGSECQFSHFMLTSIGRLNYFCWTIINLWAWNMMVSSDFVYVWFYHCSIDRFSNNQKRMQMCPNTMLDPPLVALTNMLANLVFFSNIDGQCDVGGKCHSGSSHPHAKQNWLIAYHNPHEGWVLTIVQQMHFALSVWSEAQFLLYSSHPNYGQAKSTPKITLLVPFFQCV